MTKERLFTFKIIEKGPTTERPYGDQILYRGYLKTDHPVLKDKFLNVPMFEKKLHFYKNWSTGDEVTALIRKSEKDGKTFYDVLI